MPKMEQEEGVNKDGIKFTKATCAAKPVNNFETVREQAKDLGYVLITKKEAEHFEELKNRKWHKDSSFTRMA